jgi:pimeloyl-[acyl-carrier protein] methyl ester esterase
VTRIRFVTQEGWALNSAFWKPLERELRPLLRSREVIVQSIDEVGEINESDATVLLTHSFGSLRHHLQTQPLPIRFVATICCAGFARFTATGESPEGVPTRLLDRMIRRFHDSPSAVVSEFLSRAAAPFPLGETATLTGCIESAAQNSRRLLDELEDMRSETVALQMLNRREPLLALACSDDAIVAPELTARLVNAVHPSVERSSQSILFASGGHLFPLFKPKETAEAIATFLAKVL